MDSGTMVPLLLPLAAWPLARFAGQRLGPPLTSWLLTITAVVLALGSTTALLVLAFAGLSLAPQVARLGDWSPQALRDMEFAPVPVEAACGGALAVLGITAVIAGVRYVRWFRGLRHVIDGIDAAGELVVLPGTPALAVAVPLRGGRIVVSQAMLAALDPAERRALLLHERAHLRCHHHLFLAAVALATALNPLLWPLRSAVVFALERWADEATARRLGDRHVVASAVSKAALAAGDTTSYGLAAAGGPVPRRVSALLNAPVPRLDRRLVAAVIIAVAVWSGQATIEAAADLHSGIEAASLDRPPSSHGVITQRSDP